jgi:nucleotide sugar dehydrogenase
MNKIKRYKYKLVMYVLNKKVCIIGVGYVGEHLVDTFKNGYKIVGVDLNKTRIEYLKDIYKKYRHIKLQSTYSNIEDCEVFLISVPTLVKNGEIDMSYLYSVRDSIKDIVKPGSLIVVESSVYVGATREIFGDFHSKGIYVGFSPERVDPGRIEPKMEDIPKIISGVDTQSLDKVRSIYSKVIKNIVVVSSTECAEMCKLYENCFRMINIAYVNEIADMCKEHKIDCYEMIDASSTKPYGFMPFYPGLGVGGHCIPVNPYYLLKNGKLPVLKYSMEMMTKRPKIISNDILTKYKEKNSIMICGIGFKKGQGLLTNSPGFALYKELCNNKNIIVFEPYVEKMYPYGDIKFINEKDIDNLKNIDLIIVVHSYINNKIIKIYKKNGVDVLWYTRENN